MTTEISDTSLVGLLADIRATGAVAMASDPETVREWLFSVSPRHRRVVVNYPGHNLPDHKSLPGDVILFNASTVEEIKAVMRLTPAYVGICTEALESGPVEVSHK